MKTKMKNQVITDDGGIDLAELSKYNGQSELENIKLIIAFLTQKAEAYGIPQTVRLTYKGEEDNNAR